MNLSPPERYKPRPHALLIPGTGSCLVRTLWGDAHAKSRRDVELALQKLRGHACYVAGALRPLVRTTDAQSWELALWRGREVSARHVPSGVTVTSLRGGLDAEADPFAALTTFLSWVGGYGVAAGSLTGMAWRLLCATLSHPVSIFSDPAISRAALFGGRQEVRLRHEDQLTHYRHQKLLDIKGAYPAQMARLPVALSFREVDPRGSLDPTEPGLARATVTVPQDLPHAPLPVRVAPDAIQFQTGTLTGTWPWCELAAAQALGCVIHVDQSWAPARIHDLFGPWWPVVQQGRELDQGAQLAKTLAVTTWGPFAMSGEDRSMLRFTDDRGEEAYEVAKPRQRMPHEWASHVAAEVTARVRVQLLTEALYGLPVAPVHVDTDGVIVRESAMIPTNFGDDFGQWRVKAHLHDLDVAAPQLLRYTDGCAECVPKARYHYIASGMTADQAKWFFEHHGQVTRISYLAREDAVLPSCSSFDENRIADLLGEARLYGRGLEREEVL